MDTERDRHLERAITWGVVKAVVVIAVVVVAIIIAVELVSYFSQPAVHPAALR